MKNLIELLCKVSGGQPRLLTWSYQNSTEELIINSLRLLQEDNLDLLYCFIYCFKNRKTVSNSYKKKPKKKVVPLGRRLLLVRIPDPPLDVVTCFSCCQDHLTRLNLTFRLKIDKKIQRIKLVIKWPEHGLLPFRFYCKIFSLSDCQEVFTLRCTILGPSKSTLRRNCQLISRKPFLC